jgi:hypothetical protein
MMKNGFGSLIIASFILVGGTSAYPDDSGEQAATTASNRWLQLVDKGQYSQSWNQASQYFKNHVKRAQWQAQVSAARSPFGKVIERKLRSTNPATSLPGAPDGNYVVIQYDTAFEKKNAAVETVTPMKEANGEWRVSGYFIK